MYICKTYINLDKIYVHVHMKTVLMKCLLKFKYTSVVILCIKANMFKTD